MNKKIYKFGVAYYPDYISSQPWMLKGNRQVRASLKERMAYDFEKMKQSQIDEIRIGEFSWATIEPSFGKFETETIDLCLDFAEKGSIEVIMCTPTSTPPKWLFDRYPDMFPLRNDGRKVHWGSRRHYDPLHPNFIEHAERITHFFSKSWGSHPAVVGWQIDNELGHHGSSSIYTSYAKKAFQEFLQKKYQRIEILNQNWFTCFWSQSYQGFEEIELPLDTWADINPHLQMDFREFCTSVFKKFQQSQLDIVKKNSPGRYVTHNLISNFYELCPWEMTEDLDIVGFDHYQDDPLPNPTRSLVNFSLMHGLGQKKGKTFKILEQQPVQVNWQSINRRFDLDWLLLWAGQSSMLGASSMDYFSFQKFYGGAEQFHDGLLPHDLRNPSSPQEKVMRASHEMFSNLSMTFGWDTLAARDSDIFIVHNTKSLWSHRICSQSTNYDAVFQLDDLSKLFSQTGIGFKYVENIPEDLSSCKILILPGYAFELTPDEQQRICAYVKNGGSIWTFPRTSMKQENNHMSPIPLSILDGDGFYFEDFGALGPEETESIKTLSFPTTLAPHRDVDGKSIHGYRWAEKIKLTSSVFDILGFFNEGIYEGSPAILKRKFGGGQHIHFAFCPLINPAFVDWITDSGLLKSNIKSGHENLHIYPMHFQKEKFYGLVNFSNNEVRVSLSDLKPSESVSFQLNSDLKLVCREVDINSPISLVIGKRSVTWIKIASST